MFKNLFTLRLKTYVWLLALTIGCLVGYYYNHLGYNNNVTDLFTKKQNENSTLVKSIVGLNQQKAESLARDYSYWDEMVDFVNNPSASWAEFNIDTALLSFGVEGIWVFRTDNTLAYSIKTEEGQIARNTDFYLPIETRSQLFTTNRTIDFYLKNSEGEYEEVHGATIHPSSDPERKTDPQGYLLVTRDVNTTHLNQLGSYTGSTVTSSLEAPTINESELINKGVSLNSLPLTDWQKKTIGYLNFSMELPTLKQLNAEVRRQTALTAISYATFYVAISWLIVLYGQGLVLRRKKTVDSIPTGKTT